jgi:hypothetical protein
MQIKLIRKFITPNYTIGRLYIDGIYHSDSLEDPVRDLSDYNHDGDFDDQGEGKIYGQTAIPAGEYKVIVSHSPKFNKRLPELLKVPGFTGIRIHAGANVKHTEGCILIGENKVKGSLVNSAYYVTTLIQMIDEAIDNGEKCTIIIKQ